MTLRLSPCTITDARAWIDRHHSHHAAPIGGLFAVAVEEAPAGLLGAEPQAWRRCCVALAGRPVARLLAGCCEITRVASDGTPHAASMAVGAITRAAVALGYQRVVSYILLGERGTSYRAAGWWPTAITARPAGRWGSSRARGPAAQDCPKVRWEAGPGALPRNPVVEAELLAAVGTVEHALRQVAPLPLFDPVDFPTD